MFDDSRVRADLMTSLEAIATLTAVRPGPVHLWLVRHGESAGNAARDIAHRDGLPRIAIDVRDVDVPLSPRGEKQADALGHWFRDLPEDERPTQIWVSPYVRARETALRIRSAAGLELEPRVDERLREKEFGILDGLTRLGIEAEHPELARQRASVGKFYHRPPGGESWCDVIARLRSATETLFREAEGERVLIVAHQVVVLCMRYLLEQMDEKRILDIDAQGDVANCSVTSYAFDEEGVPALQVYNFVAPLLEEGASVTARPDAPAPRS